MSALKKEKNLFSDKDFEYLREFFVEISGNRLPVEKRILLESRLRKRINELKIPSQEYVKYLKSHENEVEFFVDVLTTHKTEWFRENIHFDFLRESTLVDHEPIRIWSAASSTGEEAFSIAMTLMESGLRSFRILGTDISGECIRHCHSAIYDRSQVMTQIESALVCKYFLKNSHVNKANQLMIVPELRQYVKWREFNLLTSELPISIDFNYIFLRNVLIYFEQEDISKIVNKMTRYLKLGGYLIIGLSETIPRPEAFGLKRIKNSIYQKVDV